MGVDVFYYGDAGTADDGQGIGDSTIRAFEMSIQQFQVLNDLLLTTHHLDK